MKALLKILYTLLFLVIVILLAGIFLPGSSKFSSETVIKSYPSIVFDQINTLKNWESWSPWIVGDTLAELDYNSTLYGDGAKCSWVSKKFGEGQITISESKENNYVKSQIDLKSFGQGTYILSLSMQDDQVQLHSELSLESIGYFERYYILFFRKAIRSRLDYGMSQLKNISEELRKSRISLPKLISVEKFAAMAIIDTVETKDLELSHENNLQKLRVYLQRRKIEITGDPLAIFYSYDPKGKTIYASGFPIPERTWGWREYTCILIEQPSVATLTHWGDYSSAKPYLALDEFLNINKLEADSFIWEVYQVSKKIETDTGMWQKQLFYPIKMVE